LKLCEKWSWKKNYAWILLILFLLISFLLKFSALNRYVAPSGSDPGNYLFVADAFQGNDIAGFGLRYPPLFYLLVSLTLKLFDEYTALKIIAGVVATIIGIPFFVLARKLSDGLIALICTVLFVFCFEYFGIPAWGGYGNLLGIFFLLFFLLFLSNAFERPSTKNLFFTALFFALILGVHVIVLVFTIFTILIFVLLAVVLDIQKMLPRLHVLFRKSLICGFMSLVFSLPFLPSYYLMMQDYSFSTSANSSLDVLLRSIPTLQFILYSCAILISLYILFRYKGNIQINTVYILITALFLCPFLTSFATPPFSSKMIRRSPVFWCIPGLLSVAIALRLARKHFKKALVYSLFFSLFIASVVWFIPQSLNYLHRSVDYYQVIKDDELAALSWIIQNTNRNDVILCSGSHIRKLGWWVQGSAKRKAISTEETYWFKDFTFEGEREEAEIASRILSEGDHIIENGLIRVADYSFQKDVDNNPVIALKDIGKYQNLILLNDSSVNLNFSTLSNPRKKYMISPWQSENKSIHIYQTEELGKLQYLFKWKNATIKRTVMLEKNAKYVDISYEVDLINATAESLEVCIWPYLALSQWKIFEDSSIGLVQNVEGKPICSNISLTLDDVECIDCELDQKNQSKYLSYRFASNKTSFHIKIRVNFQSAVIREIKPIEYYDIADLLKHRSIDYIFIDKSHQRRCKWLRESGYFKKVFDSQRIVIFRVNVEETVT